MKSSHTHTHISPVPRLASCVRVCFGVRVTDFSRANPYPTACHRPRTVYRESCEVMEGHKGTVSCIFELPGKRHDAEFGTDANKTTSDNGTGANNNSADLTPAAVKEGKDANIGPGSAATALLRKLQLEDVFFAEHQFGKGVSGLGDARQHRQYQSTTLVATGSADGTVRLWKAPAIAHMRQQSGWWCTQTLEGHGGTITSITGAPGLLVTGSTDRSVKLWKAVEGRRATFYPWYDLSKTLSVMGSWVTSLSYSTTHNVGDLGSLYVGEDSGDVHVFRGRPLSNTTAAASSGTSGATATRLGGGVSDDTDPVGNGFIDSDGSVNGAGLHADVHSSGAGGGSSSAGLINGSSHEERSSATTVMRWGAVSSSADIDFERAKTSTSGDTGNQTDALAMMGAGSSSGNLAWRRVGSRGVSKITFVSSLDLVLTLSNDYCMRIFDVKQHSSTGDLGLDVNDYADAAGNRGFCQNVIMNEHSCNFTDMEYDPVNTQVLLCDKYGFLYIFCLEDRKMIFTSRVLHAAILAIHLRPGRSGLDSRPREEELVLLTERGIHFCSIERGLEYYQFPGGHTGPVICVHASDHGAGITALRDDDDDDEHDATYEYNAVLKLYSASLDNTVRVWDPYDLTCQRILEESESEISSMCVSRSRGTIVTGHDDGCIRVWEVDTGSTVNIRKHTNTVSCMCCGTVKKTGEEIVITGSFDGRVGIWDVRNRMNDRPHLVSLFPQGSGTEAKGSGNAWDKVPSEILAVHYDANHHAIITGGNDADIKVYDASTCELIGAHVGHAEAVTCFASDENFLFSGSEDTTIKMWDTLALFPDVSGASHGRSRSNSDSGAGICVSSALSTLRKHTHTVVALAPAGRGAIGFLVSAGHDGVLLVWDYTSGAVLYSLHHHEEFKCLAVVKNDVIIGTEECNLLRIPLLGKLKLSAADAAMPGELEGSMAADAEAMMGDVDVDFDDDDEYGGNVTEDGGGGGDDDDNDGDDDGDDDEN